MLIAEELCIHTAGHSCSSIFKQHKTVLTGVHDSASSSLGLEFGRNAGRADALVAV